MSTVGHLNRVFMQWFGMEEFWMNYSGRHQTGFSYTLLDFKDGLEMGSIVQMWDKRDRY